MESTLGRHSRGSRHYDRVHDMEELGDAVIGWVRDVCPTDETAVSMLHDLFVM